MPEHNPLACLDCGGQGWVWSDGDRRACPNGCEASIEWKRARGGTQTSPFDLPPGGDVLMRRDATEAAGLPPGALDGRPVRAIIVADGLLAGMSALVADVLTCGNPIPPQLASRCRVALAQLPEEVVDRIGVDRITAALSVEDRKLTGAGVAGPLKPPE